MSEIGIYAQVYSPHSQGEQMLDDHFEIENLTAESLAVGGFWSASTSKPMTLNNAEEWYDHGLGRVFNFLDHEGFLVWRGFANSITLNSGAISEVRGPLLDVINRVQATYTPRDFSVYPPVDRSQTTTIINQDDFSIAKYGVLQGVVQGGTCPDDVAEKIRDRALAEMRIPKTTNQFSLTPGSAETPTVSIELYGNIRWMTKYIYDNPTDSLSYLSDKIKAVLAYDPNGIISTDYSRIIDNLYLVNDLEVKLRYAWDVISELLSIGSDSDDTRRILGMYENDQIIYSGIPTSIDYQYSFGKEQEVSLYNTDSLVYPWRVRPGKWIAINDFLIGRNIVSSNLFGDPRNKFIERVQFSTPYGIDVSGGDISKLTQMVSKVTYSGGIY